MKHATGTVLASAALTALGALPAAATPSGLITFEKNPNDTLAQAITSGNVVTDLDAVYGGGLGPGDIDFWKLTLPAGAEFAISASAPFVMAGTSLVYEAFDVDDLMTAIASATLTSMDLAGELSGVVPDDGMLALKVTATMAVELYQFEVTVPEPASASLLAAGLAALGALRRRQRRPEARC